MWTKEQQAVIDNRGSNLLVAAAAGSGKTAVLIERIVQRILDKDNPVDIDKMLVLTFTKAAANEMKERVRVSIEKALYDDPDNKNLQKQMMLLNKAEICTIDSFCGNVLKKNFHVTDLDCNVKVCDPTEIDIISQEVLDELFEDLYEADDEEFLKLVEYYSSKNTDDGLSSILLALNNFINSSPEPEKWLDSSAEFFNTKDKDDKFYLINYFYPIAKEAYISLRYINTLCKSFLEEIFGCMDLEPYYDSINSRLEFIGDVGSEILDFISSIDEVKKIDALNIENKDEDINNYVESAKSSWDKIISLVKKYLNTKFTTFRATKKMDPIEKERYYAVKDRIKENIDDAKTVFLDLSFELDHIIKESEMIYPYLRALSNICKKYREAFSKKKKMLGVVDFSDVEHYALSILTDEVDGELVPSKIANSYSEYYEEVFTDEYQDSNMVQEIILSMVSKRDIKNRFMVGDVKQSIYRFRQAMPEIFMDKYHSYDLYTDNEDSDYKKIMLYKNFRSRKEVLEGCNHVFSKIMRADTGELDYTEDERLNPGAVFEELEESYKEDGYHCGGCVEVHLLDLDDKKNKSVEIDRYAENEELVSTDEGDVLSGEVLIDDSNKKNEHELELEKIANEKMAKTIEILGKDEELDMVGFRIECVYIASIIEDMVSNNDNKFMVFDKEINSYRKVQYKDIVILMRSLKSKVSDIEDIFSDFNIPLYSDLGDGYFDTLEVDTVLNFLKVIDNPISDIELVACMRSPIFNFTPLELAEIRLTNIGGSYYDSLIEFTSDNVEIGDDKKYLRDKVSSFLDKINYFREKSLFMNVSDFIWFILRETGYMSYVSMLEMGEHRKQNLLLLFERAKQYENTSYTGIFNFINYIERLKSKNTNLAEAKNVSEDANVVKIMSIHKSKGLEFPVVIVANANKKFNFVPDNDKVDFHQEMGYGPKIYDRNKRVRFDSMYKKIISRKKINEQIAEEMRLLYVAMTRAKEKLIFTSSIKKLENSMKSWNETLTDENFNIDTKDVLTANTYLNWIMPTIIPLNKKETIKNCRGNECDVIGYGDSKWQIMKDDLESLKKRYIDTLVKKASIEEIYEESYENINCENSGKIIDSSEDIDKDRGYSQGIEKKPKKNIDSSKDVENNVKNDIASDEDVDKKIEKNNIKEILDSKLNYVYEYSDIANKPSRISVTDIKRLRMEYEEKNNILSTELNVDSDKRGDIEIDKSRNRDIDIEIDENKYKNQDIDLGIYENKYRNQDIDLVIDENKYENQDIDVEIDGNNGLKVSVEGDFKRELTIPEFMHSKKVKKEFTSSEKGTILHLVMQVLDFSIFEMEDEYDITVNKIKKSIANMVDKKILTKEESDTVNIEWIVKFVKNPLFREIKNAISRNKLYKEKAINFNIDMNDIYKDIEKNKENIMVVGIIDLFFEREDNTYVLIDYKTDYVPNMDTNIIVDRYKVQLETYKKAMENISGKEVSQVYLYLFSIGKLVAVN